MMYVSASGDRDAVASTATWVRRTIQSVRPDLPAATITLLRDRAEPQMRPWRLGATMFTLFGGVALIIAVVGLYGVVSFAAAQRSKEVAIRVALGARAGHVMAVIAGEGIAAVVAGLVLGTVAAMVMSTWVGKLLFQTSARDPMIFLGVGVILLVVAAVAGVVPTRQVLKRSPAAVLRSE